MVRKLDGIALWLGILGVLNILIGAVTIAVSFAGNSSLPWYAGLLSANGAALCAGASELQKSRDRTYELAAKTATNARLDK